jgi:hypothetical protein
MPAHFRAGYQSGCQHLEFMTGAQAPYARVPLADGTLLAMRDNPSDELVPSLFAVSDVLGRTEASRGRLGSR